MHSQKRLRKKPLANGQASLEFILVLAAFLAALALILPTLFEMADSLLWWNEVANVQSFAQKVQASAKELNVFGNGSRLEIHANPQSEWNLSVHGKILKLQAVRKNSAKTFERELALEGMFEQSFDSAFTLVLRKENNSIIFETR